MSDHNQLQPDYRQIVKYEKQIENLLNYNVHKYRYVGEQGKEYEVIQSIFKEINSLRELSNQQIRWYAVIINLMMSFQNFRLRRENGDKDCFRDFSILTSPGANGSRVYTPINKSQEKEVYLPPYIALIELYINNLARLGMLVCTKEKLSPGFLEFKLKKIDSSLGELLRDMACSSREEHQEEVFILTIYKAAENALKLESYLPESRKMSPEGSFNWELYQKLIIRRMLRMDETMQANYNNIEAFWNGFIP